MAAKLQPVAFHDCVKTVETHVPGRAETAVVHPPQLASSHARILAADLLDVVHHERFQCQVAQQFVVMLVVLPAHTKQTAHRDNALTSLVPDARPTRYLVPAFLALCRTPPLRTRPSLHRSRHEGVLSQALSSNGPIH